MGMKKKFDAVFAGEKYTDRDGNEKTRYQNMGAVFTRDDGSMTMKLESIPVGFTGWIIFFEPKADDGSRGRDKPLQSRGQGRQESSSSGRTAPPGDDPFNEDDIPF